MLRSHFGDQFCRCYVVTRHSINYPRTYAGLYSRHLSYITYIHRIILNLTFLQFYNICIKLLIKKDLQISVVAHIYINYKRVTVGTSDNSRDIVHTMRNLAP